MRVKYLLREKIISDLVEQGWFFERFSYLMFMLHVDVLFRILLRILFCVE